MEMTSSGLFLILCVVCRFYSTHGITLTWVSPTGGQSVSKSEDLAINAVVLTLDAGTPASDITYSFVSAQPAEFSIAGTDDDELQLVSALDYETTPTSYSITLRATETAVPTNTADVTFTIVVLNVNDNGPVLQATSTSIDVKEGTASAITLATITHTDADTDTGMIEATYVLTSGDDGGFFTLVGGVLQTTSTPTDYATTNSFTLLITGTDTNNNALTGTINIGITITTEPTFTLPASGGSSESIVENAAAAVVVFTFAVSDADGVPSAVTTTFTGDDSLFVISGSDLVVKSGAVFDFETTTEYTVTFHGTDGLYVVNSETLTISITDVNEAPVYDTNTPTSTLVQDTTSIGDAVDGFLAPNYVTDPEGDTIQYSLSGTSLLAIDPSTGALTTAAAIVYDSANPSFTATITATDDGTLSASHTVTFNVKTAPVITLPAQAVELNEDSVNPYSVYTFAATDEDGDSTFTFTIDSQSVAGTFVKAGDDTGIIVASGTTFDYDNGPTSYTVTLQCVDENSLSSTAVLTVNIANVNDENPTFTSSSADVIVAEDLVPGNGDTLYTAAATDDVNNALTYAITAGNTGDVFSIDPSSGVVVLQSAVSYATLPSYTIVFTVTDTPLQTATLSVIFNVKTAPVITLPAQAVELNEDSVNPYSVYIFAATDEDGDSTFTFTIDSQSVAGTFVKAGDDTGIIVASGTTFDYDNGPTSYTVTIQCADVNSLSSTAVLTVNIVNVNDENPTFTSSSADVNVAENLVPGNGDTLYTAAATDDVNNALTYAITAGNTGDVFSIDPSSGVVVLQSAVSYATLPSYTIVFTVTDTPLQTATLSVIFNVKTAPVITLPAQAVELNEDSVNPYSVYIFAATDEDGDSTFTFTIDSQSVAGTFVKAGDDTGIIVASGTTFDYDNGPTSYTVTIQCADVNSLSSTAVLTVNIVNVNDENPTFTSSSADVIVAENLVPGNGDTLYTAAATDDVNNALTYAITAGNTGDVFSIDPSSGVVVLQSAVSYATLSSYTIVFTVTDTPLQTATLSVIFNVKTAPVITLPAQAVELNEDSVNPYSVYIFAATDEDGDSTFTFTIDSQSVAGTFVKAGDDTGIIVASGTTFDYDNGPTSYTVTIQCADVNSLSSTAVLTVNIVNVNDENPTFTSSSADVNVAENLVPGNGDTLYTAAATDDVNNALTYAITAGNTGDVFSIDASSGVVVLQSAVSYATLPSYTIVFTVTDTPLQTATLSVIFNVKTAPVFTSGITATTDENTAATTSIYGITTSDADGDTNPTYTIASQSVSGAFGIDGTNLIVSTSASLDYESLTEHSVVLNAEDSNGIIGSVTVTVTITNLNDEPPVFTSSAGQFDIAINTAAATSVYQAVATDDAASVTYTITSGNDAGLFAIDENSGDITTTAIISVSTPVSLVITASDSVFTTTLTVSFVVRTAPTLTLPSNDIQDMSETSNIGSVVYAFVVSDADGDTGHTFTIVSQTPQEAFQISGTDIVTTATFDFETGTTSYSLLLRVEDDYPMSSEATLTIAVTDANDETPVFTHSSHVALIKENKLGHPFLLASATDADNGDSITYSLQVTSSPPVELFHIHATTGQLSTTAALTYDPLSPTISILLKATDGTGNEGTSPLVVTVIEETDVAFVNPSPSPVSIPEDSASGTSLIDVSATDADEDTLTFAVIASGDKVTKANTGTHAYKISTSTTFDFETVTTPFEVIYTMTDENNTPFVATATLTVSITDVNDNAPVFAPLSYSASLQEHVDTAVVTVAATDDDSSLHDNNVIEYSITGGNDANIFSIDSSTGVITADASGIDYATATEHTLVVTANDLNGAVGALSSTADVVVSVETAPAWTEPDVDNKQYPISENIAADSPIIQLSATDADGVGVVSYSIVSQTPSSPADLIVFDTTGLLVRGETSFDKDDGSPITSVTLALRVTDSTYTTDVNIVVNIQDENDETPAFQQSSYTFTVPETAAVGYIVGTVIATDNDFSEAFRDITYSLTGTDFADFIMSTSVNGQIEVAASLVGVAGPYSLTVNANDGINEGTATLTVTIVTEPVWSEPGSDNKNYYMGEDAASGDLILTLVADDTDNSPSALVYSIESETPSIGQTPSFVLDGATGEISRGAIDFDYDSDTATTQITLAVRVTDGQFQQDRTIIININDVNDIAPVFSPGSYSFQVSENAAPGSSVGVVTATDNDLTSQFNTLTYVLSGDNAGHFVMSSVVEGQINTAISMQNAPTPYSLTLTVSDTTNTATTSVAINVKTVPQFTQPPTDGYEKLVIENAASNLYQLQSVDTDGDTQTYTILSQTPSTPAGLFVLSSSVLGQIDIGVGETLDYDSNDIAESYTLGVRVSDGTTDVDSSVVIRITDLNDESPTFTTNTYQFTVSESETSGSSVGTITATDDDINSAFNGITYSLSGTGSSDFELTSTGQINVNAQLDHDTTSTYSLTATASDSLNEDTAIIVLSVKTAPGWTSPDSAVSVTVAENIDSSHAFYQINAADADGDSLTLSIKSQTVTDFFVLGGISGRDVLMNTGKVLDFEANQLHTLTFEVTDGTHAPVLSAQLEVIVTDENDNSPSFQASSLNIYVKDTTQVGATVATLSALDADSSTNNNNVIIYSIIDGNTAGDFALSSQGVLTLENAYSTGDSETIVVRATDGGTGPLTGEVTLIIAATTPSNPVLTAPMSSGATVSISETLAVGSTVYTIQASDSDGDSLIYSIVSPSPPPAEFRLADNVLQVKVALDYETTTSYQIVFEVDDDDGDTSNKLTSGTLTVTIINENDHFPTFSQEFHTVQVMEQQTDVIDVLQLTATDRDIGVAGDLTYSIVYGDHFGQFTVDSSGKLKTTNVALLYSKQRSALLGIQAKDGGTPVRADSTHVKVDVTMLTDQSGAMFVEWNLAVVVVPVMCTVWKIIG